MHQYVGMGKELYDDSRLVQELFEEASAILDMNFVKLCFASSEAELAKMQNALPSIFLIGTAYARLLQEAGIEPEIMGGFNFGEFTALGCAGGFTFADGLYLISKYTQFYEQFVAESNQSIIKVHADKFAEFENCVSKKDSGNEHVVLAIDDAQKDRFYSVDAKGSKLVEKCTQISDIPQVSAQIELELHSQHAQAVLELLKPYMAKVDCKDLKVPVVDGTTGKLIKSGEQVADRILNRIVQPIFYQKTEKQLVKNEILVCVGPGQQLAQELKQRYPHTIISSVNERSDINALKTYIQHTVGTE